MRPRLVVLGAAVAALLPATASAAPQLIGRQSAPGPFRFLDRDLRVVEGSPRIPARASRTLLAPGGRRFLAFGTRDLFVYDRRTGERLVRRPLRGASPLLWPSPGRLVLAGRRGRVLIRLDLATGRRRTVALPNGLWALDVIGGELRAVVVRPGAAPVVQELRPSGAVRRSITLPLPAGTTASATSTSFQWVGERLLVSGGDGAPVRLVTFDGTAATVRTLDLAPALWAGLTPTLLHTGGVDRTLARIDPDTGAVLRTAAVPGVFDDSPGFVPSSETEIPYAGGAIVGGGRLRYDAGLRVVAANPAARPAIGPRAVRRGHRLYVRTFDCTDGSTRPVRVRIVDADSLRTIRARRFIAVGILGGPDGIDESSDDDCD